MRVNTAILPDPASSKYSPDVVLISVLAERIRALMPQPDNAAIMQGVEDLPDRSVAPIPHATPEKPEVIDISAVNFDKLRAMFDTGGRRTEAETATSQVRNSPNSCHRNVHSSNMRTCHVERA